MIDLLDGSEVEDGMRLTLVWWFAASFVDLVVLGATCTDRDCRKVATYDVAWPGGYGTLAYCTRHHDLLARIADAMGFELVSSPRIVRSGDAFQDAEREAVEAMQRAERLRP